MVYKILMEDGRDIYSNDTTESRYVSLLKWNIPSESLSANILIVLVRSILFIYDLISYPIYFILQNPDKRASEAHRTRSVRVDTSTWIRSDASPSFSNYLLNDVSNFEDKGRGINGNITTKYNHMGTTLSEIFAKAIRDYSDNQCLGYRAVVTCPVLSVNELGENAMIEKSFRSEYTWYTYEQIGRRVQDMASGLYQHLIIPGSRALFLANTSVEWFCASQACFQLACQVVLVSGINDNLSLRAIFCEAEIDCIFVSCDQLTKLSSIFKQLNSSELPSSMHIKRVIVIDWLFTIDFSESEFGGLRDAAGQLVDQIISMGQLEETGTENPLELNCTEAIRDYNCQDYETLRRISRSVTKDLLDVNNHRAQLQQADSDAATESALSKRRFIIQDLETGSKTPENETTTQTSMSTRNFSRTGERKPSVKPKIPPDLTGSKHRFGLRCSSPRLRNPGIFEIVDESRTGANDVAMIVYTSGALGALKSLKLTHAYLARSSHHLFLDGMIGTGDVHCATLALDNVIEFMTEMCVFSRGGCIGYSCSMETLFYDGQALFKRDKSDLEALNPTFLMVRPYILESLRTSMQNYLNLELNPLISFMMTNVLFVYKKYWARRHLATPILDRLFFSHLRGLFGHRLKYILCNGATDCSDTKDFFRFMLNVPVVELYGPGEALASMMSVNDTWDYKSRFSLQEKRNHRLTGDNVEHEDDNDDFDEKIDEDFYKNMRLLPPKVDRNIFEENRSNHSPTTSSILCPTLGARIRLEDWEDFRTSDLPYPRGRLVIGSDPVCSGYFKRPEEEKKLFYSDSNSITWFRTDDLARVFPNGSFEIISGISDMMRMSDGQFISLSQIEHILRNSQFVDNVCAVCADDRKFVVVLVVPNLRRLVHKSHGEANLKMVIGGGIEPEAGELADIEFRREICNDRLLCEFVSAHLNELIQRAGLNAVLNKFLLVPEIWAPETELVTPAYEPKRTAIKKFYAADIQSIFQSQFGTGSSFTSGNNRGKSKQAKRLSARLSSPFQFKSK